MIDDLKWVSEPCEILNLLKENYPDLTLTVDYISEYSNLQVAETKNKGSVIVQFEQGDKTIVCAFSEIIKLFTVED